MTERDLVDIVDSAEDAKVHLKVILDLAASIERSRNPGDVSTAIIEVANHALSRVDLITSAYREPVA